MGCVLISLFRSLMPVGSYRISDSFFMNVRLAASSAALFSSASLFCLGFRAHLVLAVDIREQAPPGTPLATSGPWPGGEDLANTVYFTVHDLEGTEHPTPAAQLALTHLSLSQRGVSDMSQDLSGFRTAGWTLDTQHPNLPMTRIAMCYPRFQSRSMGRVETKEHETTRTALS